ncbi:MAG: hypothetical protein JWQ11_2650 [Rhizobacter sp.]|nr:hypothetical protein [Rhizobacter sp.]
MAKTKVTTHKFYVVDLVRNKPKTQFIEIPAYRVDVQLDVTTTGILSASEVPSSAMKRLEVTARGVLEDYEKIIASEAAKLDAKIAKMAAEPTAKSKAEAEALTQGVNQSIKNALASANGAIDKAVEAQLKKEAQGDKNLKEARVRTAIKVGGAVISIGTAVARLVPTMGADVSAWLQIAKTAAAMGAEIAQQVKNEAKLRSDLDGAVQAYITLRGTTLMQAAKRQGVDTSGIDIKKPLEAIAAIAGKISAAGAEITKGRSKVEIAKEVMEFAVKGIKAKLSDAEAARVFYRNYTVRTREKVDSLGGQADALMKKVKSATTLKDGVKIGAACMAVKREVTTMAAKLVDREKYLDEMQRLMTGNGLTIDDRTTLDKLKALDKMTIGETGKELYSNIKAVYELVSAVT